MPSLQLPVSTTSEAGPPRQGLKGGPQTGSKQNASCSPYPKMSPEDTAQALLLRSTSLSRKSKSLSDLVLSGRFSPHPWRETEEAQAEQSFRQTNPPTPTPGPGSLDVNRRKVQSQHCDQKRSFGKFFSKRDHEFCPLECPRAVLIGSVA